MDTRTLEDVALTTRHPVTQLATARGMVALYSGIIERQLPYLTRAEQRAIRDALEIIDTAIANGRGV